MIKNVNNSPLHLTLREMQSGVFNIQFAIWMAAAVTVLTIAGPFGTLSAFNTLERLAYWLLLTPTTFLLASFCSTFVVIYLYTFGIGKWFSYAIAGTLAGIPVGITVWLFQFFTKDLSGSNLNFLVIITSKTIPITFAITMLYASLSKNRRDDASKIITAESALSTDLFFSRLSRKLGRDLISLNAQDHYVNVKTALGSELILMRISDAIAELSTIEGFQTHRSWWVAKKHVCDIQSIDGKKYLALSDETKVPVSRSFAKNIQSLTQKPKG